MPRSNFNFRTASEGSKTEFRMAHAKLSPEAREKLEALAVERGQPLGDVAGDLIEKGLASEKLPLLASLKRARARRKK